MFSLHTILKFVLTWSWIIEASTWEISLRRRLIIKDSQVAISAAQQPLMACPFLVWWVLGYALFYSPSDHFFFFHFIPAVKHMEVPRLGIKSELQLQAYVTDTVMPDPSHVCDLCHSLWQHEILNPLTEARDQICIFTDTMLGS